MRLSSGGIDIFYIDESHDNKFYVVTAIAVPFLRQVNNVWTLTWPQHFEQARAWRRRIKNELGIPTSKELHAVKLASGRGNFLLGKHNFNKPKSGSVYRKILKSIDFLPDHSIISVCAPKSHYLYGNYRLEAALYAIFQRMRKQAQARNVNAFVFFDQGHPEYRTLYRKAQIYLPTGSTQGRWARGTATENFPLNMFLKDANEKDSKHCFFTQTADIIAYAAFLKIKSESGTLSDWQSQYGYGNIYNSIPNKLINTKASYVPPKDGIVRLK